MLDNNQDASKNVLEFTLNDFQEAIAIFCDNNNIDDLKSESQLVFSACMQYINMTIISPSKLLKNNPNIDNKTNLFKVYQLAVLYKYICALYNKVCNINGFTTLTNISYQSMSEWSKGIYNNVVYCKDDLEAVEIDGYKLSSLGSELIKLLNSSEQSTLETLLLDKKNPVGPLAILNHKYGWTREAPQEQTAENVLELDQINSKYGLIGVND